MKQKQLKTLLILLVPLCMIMLGFGCDKEDNNHGSDSIIGKWEWIYSLGGVVGITYPEEGKTVSLEFTEDSVLIERINGTITLQSDFHVSGDTLKYYRLSDRMVEVVFEISNDTLTQFYKDLESESFYKRIK